ncbi:hypothetical protein Gotri_002447 [Gossypium trilobum]|uniref:Uncharacterized protein n=1 Tax=Gossypium trilobum TaxID=34281 RepID=A0A7J9F8B1_9ROSI|nr:hypothetical protein [Gossypium trilobum]
MSWKDKFLGVGSASSGKEHMESSDGSDGGTIGYLWPVPDCPVMDQIFFSTTTVPERGYGLDQVVETIDSRTRGRFARMAVFINLDRPLVSQLCPLVVVDPFSESGKEPTIVNPREVKIGVGGAVGMTYGPWMMVEWKSWHGKSDLWVSKDRITEKSNLRLKILGSKWSGRDGFDVGFEARVGSVKSLECGLVESFGPDVTDKFISNPQFKLISVGDTYACSSSELMDLEVVDRVASTQKSGLGYVTVTHFNPTFKDTDSTNVTLDDAVLDSGKHSAMTFKENTNLNKDGALSEADFSNGYIDNSGSKSIGGKAALVCIIQKLNQTIKDHRYKFKLVGTARISFPNFMNSMVKLINNQLSNEVGKDSSPSDRKWLEEVGLPKQ